MGPRRRRRRAPAPGAARGQPSATWAGETRGQRTPWPYPAGSEGLHERAARRIRGGEVLFCTSFRPLAARGTPQTTKRHVIGHRTCLNQTAVDFHVHRSAEEQDGGDSTPDG